MALKLKLPTAEEQEFCKHVNELLRESGARVSAYTVLHPVNELLRESGARVSAYTVYHLTFQHGSKRKSIHSDVPFHYDPPQAVMQRVHDWIAGVRLTNRWTTELPKDLED